MDIRFSMGELKALPALAAALVATKPDLLLLAADQPILAIAKNTRTIPTVFAVVNDPVGLGVILLRADWVI